MPSDRNAKMKGDVVNGMPGGSKEKMKAVELLSGFGSIAPSPISLVEICRE
jgi:hypothetical protein